MAAVHEITAMMQQVRLKYAFFVSALLVGSMWLIDLLWGYNIYKYGVYPRRLDGLFGIIFAPFLHANLNHLLSNSFPLWLLSFGLFYFYPKRAWRVLLISWFGTYFLLWLIGRPGYHIGASGLVYALTSFHIFAGIFTGKPSGIALSLVVIFLYGSSLWGMFPSLAFDKSWEGHFSGYIVGFLLALGQRSDSQSDSGSGFKKRLDFYTKADYPVDFDFTYKE